METSGSSQVIGIYFISNTFIYLIVPSTDLTSISNVTPCESLSPNIKSVGVLASELTYKSDGTCNNCG
jgi:hypothetical protein